jgi:hypothetical protein
MADHWTPDRTDPGYLRHCVRPDCAATYNALDVMEGCAGAGAGWRMFSRVILGQICPDHAGPVISGEHLARWGRWPEEDIVRSIVCACSWEWAPSRYPAVHHEYQDQWVAHLASLDAPVIDMGYLSLPAGLQEAIEAGDVDRHG